jgi:hypothetical protein
MFLLQDCDTRTSAQIELKKIQTFPGIYSLNLYGLNKEFGFCTLGVDRESRLRQTFLDTPLAPVVKWLQILTYLFKRLQHRTLQATQTLNDLVGLSEGNDLENQDYSTDISAPKQGFTRGGCSRRLMAI